MCLRVSWYYCDWLSYVVHRYCILYVCKPRLHLTQPMSRVMAVHCLLSRFDSSCCTPYSSWNIHLPLSWQGFRILSIIPYPCILYQFLTSTLLKISPHRHPQYRYRKCQVHSCCIHCFSPSLQTHLLESQISNPTCIISSILPTDKTRCSCWTFFRTDSYVCRAKINSPARKTR